MFNQPSAKNLDYMSPKKSIGTKEEHVKVLTVDPSLEQKLLFQPGSPSQGNEVYHHRKEFNIQYDKIEHPDYANPETLSQGSIKNKYEGKKSAIANRNSAESQKGLVLI